MKHPKDMTQSELFGENPNAVVIVEEAPQKLIDKKDYIEAFKKLFTVSVDNPVSK